MLEDNFNETEIEISEEKLKELRMIKHDGNFFDYLGATASAIVIGTSLTAGIAIGAYIGHNLGNAYIGACVGGIISGLGINGILEESVENELYQVEQYKRKMKKNSKE